MPTGITQAKLVSLFNKSLLSFYLRPSKVLFLVRKLGIVFILKQTKIPLLMLAEKFRKS